ncbi:MAG TPA: protein kinase [Polyangiaceae bacterium]|nr:protein kinase [Polyangiaceae bacterium]
MVPLATVISGAMTLAVTSPFPPYLAPGERLDRYELLCQVGTGGMGSVWVARLRGKRGFENLVAIKTILPQHAGDPDFDRMATDEAHIVAGIRHPNVASLLDVGEHNGLIYLVFEYIDGEQLSSLRHLLSEKRKKFPVGIALRIMADVCAGLHAAHELADPDGWPLCIVHRDISPQNIMVSTTGGVKIIDFGIAKALDRLSDDTSAGLVKGKVLYMAPEQARGDQIDRRVDVWAAGVVLYLLIAERLPIEGLNQRATLAMVASEEKAAPLPPDVPKPIAEVLRHALAPNAMERFQTAAEMHRAIEGALAHVCGPVTTADVATFVNDHAAENNETRRRLLHAAFAESHRRAGSRPSISELDETPPAPEIAERITVPEPIMVRGAEAVREPINTMPSAKRASARPSPRRVTVVRIGPRRRTWIAAIATAGVLGAGLAAWGLSHTTSASAQGSRLSLSLPSVTEAEPPPRLPDVATVALPEPSSDAPAASVSPPKEPSTRNPVAMPARPRKEPRHVFDSRK